MKTSGDGLSRDTVLVRAPEVELKLAPGGAWVALRDGEGLVCDDRALGVLEVFARPCPLTEGIGRLSQGSVGGAEAWMGLMDLVVSFYDHGILQRPSVAPPTLTLGGYGAAPVHIAMLDDRARTEAFLAALRSTVQPGDVVVDVGTGTGVLAVTAALAGARQVYAVEASEIADLAQAVFESNGVADRVTLIRGRSTQIELPERADVLVSEMIGSDPFDERILEITRDASRRLLQDSARLVPGGIRVLAVPLEVPEPERARHTFTAATVGAWSESYGIDFSPLAAAADREPQLAWITPQETRDWRALGEETLLVEVELGRIEAPSFDRRVTVPIDRPGLLGGVLIFFELELAPGIVLSTSPTEASATNHWRSPLWLDATPQPVVPGQQLTLRYHYTGGMGRLEWSLSPGPAEGR